MIKICEVRLVKLEMINSRSQQLLTMEGRQGKFYLDGFAPHDFLKLTNLISSHGGIVMSPDDETIILSKPERSSDIKNSPRFHVNWLYDSIKENNLQDIGKYLLPKQIQHSFPAIGSPSFPCEKTGMFQRNSTSLTTFSRKSSMNMNQDNYSDNFSRRKSCINSTNGGASDFEESEPSQIEENVSPNVPKVNRTSVNTSASQQFQKMKKNHLILQEKKIKQQEKQKKRVHSLDLESGSEENREKRHRKKNYISSSHSSFDTDVANIINRSADDCNSSDQSHDYSSVEIADLSDKGGEKPLVEVLLDMDFDGEGRNHEAEMENECDPMEDTNSRKDDTYSPQERKHKRRRSSKPRYIYTIEENKKILEYLAVHNLLSQTSCGYVWEKMAASEEFQNPPRNASGLQQHFNRILLPNYHKYTTDPMVISALARKEKKRLKNIINYFTVNGDGESTDGSNMSS
ncbi:uncharacterized protein LOC135166714 [Diachasmimorpha longicaudata]|uniref:uncharacterized protein LOC135166714 n=1 Tax=Diachasmimorpha longicaudata TaxID=58733 RepID=UPI0030B8BEE1